MDTEVRTCKIAGCSDKFLAREMCRKHYNVWYEANRNAVRKTRPGAKCSLQGCGRPHAGRGYCDMHLVRLARTGSVLPSKRTTQVMDVPSAPLDPDWCAWFAGFTDAEGCFLIGKGGDTRFSIGLRADDATLLSEIRDTLQVGSLSYVDNSTARRNGKNSGDACIFGTGSASSVRIIQALESDSGDFDYWLAGFSDGEACFSITSDGAPVFGIGLRVDDMLVLESIKQHLCRGNISITTGAAARAKGQKSSDKALFRVFGQNTICVVNALDGKMRSKKKEDFEVWAEAVRFSVSLNDGKRHPERKPKMLEYKKKLEDIRAKGKWKGDVGT